MADETDSFIQEIEDDLRQDQYNKIWKKYGSYFVSAIIAIILAVAGMEGWKWYTLDRDQTASRAFASALSLAAENKTEEANAALEQIASEGGGYAMLAKFRAAAMLSENGDIAGALQVYETLANEDIKSYYKDMAVILGAYIALDYSGDNGTLLSKVASLNSAGNPWSQSAREILGIQAFKNGQLEEAKTYFQSISDDATATPAIKDRANEMLNIIGN